MDSITSSETPKPIRTLPRLYTLIFFFSITGGLLNYIGSSYLATIVPIDAVGLIYIAGAIVTIFFLGNLPSFIRSRGNHLLLGILLSTLALVLFGLSFITIPLIVITLFTIRIALDTSISSSYDIYLEEYSKQSEVGQVRGWYLAIANLALAIGLFGASVFLDADEYWKLFLIAALLMLAIYYLSMRTISRIPEPAYEPGTFLGTIPQIWHDLNIRRILAANFLVHLFLAWMIIYAPIYLHEVIGFPWSKLGIVFMIMLIPYVSLPVLFGKLADKKWGEKEILMLGFVLLAISSALMNVTGARSIVVWALLLVLGRLGATAVETMSETYFFKKVRVENISSLEIFRDLKPLAYIVAPLLASLFLIHFDLRDLFIPIAIVMLSGVYFVAKLKDTK